MCIPLVYRGQVTVSYLMWFLGTEARSSGTAASALDYWAISTPTQGIKACELYWQRWDEGIKSFRDLWVSLNGVYVRKDSKTKWLTEIGNVNQEEHVCVSSGGPLAPHATDVCDHAPLFIWVLGIQTQVPACSTGSSSTEPPPQLQMVKFLTALVYPFKQICQKDHLTHSWNKQIPACVTAIRSLDNFSRMKKHIKRRFWTIVSNSSVPIPFLKALGSWDWHQSDVTCLSVGSLGSSGTEERGILSQTFKPPNMSYALKY